MFLDFCISFDNLSATEWQLVSNQHLRILSIMASRLCIYSFWWSCLSNINIPNYHDYGECIFQKLKIYILSIKNFISIDLLAVCISCLT